LAESGYDDDDDDDRNHGSTGHGHHRHRNDSNGDGDRYHTLCDEIQMLESKIGGIGVRLPDHKRAELKKALAQKRVALRHLTGK
jgi:hypothetical protein